MLNITRFTPRPGTPAADLKDMPDRYKKEPSRRLTELHFRISDGINQRLVGKDIPVLVTEPGKDGTWLARTDNYKLVALT